MDSFGGGSSGGTVVGGPSPLAASLAAQFQSNAAQAASAQSTKALQDAMNSINQQYINATYAVQPYQQTGINALDQLNQYMGLNPYNPGNAPTAPTVPTVDSLKAKITDDEMKTYITNNSSIFGGNGNPGVQYTGAGAYSNNGSAGNWGAGNNAYVSWNNDGTPNGGTSFNGLINGVMNDPNMPDAIKTYLANQQLGAAQDKYTTDNQLYQQNLNAYTQNKDLYDQYTAAGPLTPDQITAQIAAQPGYQAQLNQGNQAIANNASAKGYLGSGRLLKELSDYGQNTFSQYYGNTLSRLAGLVGSGQQAAGTAANAATSTGNSLASLYNSLGEDQANASLAGGNAIAQGVLAGNQQYQVLGQSSGGGASGLGSLLGGAASLYSAFNPSTAALCSRRLKDKINTPSKEEILSSLENLEIDRWKYKEVDGAHIGPYAEQFKELFKVGDGKTINMVDCIGVLLASVKALSSKVNTLQSKLKECNTRNT